VEIDRQFRRVEEENLALLRQIENLQAILNESEYQHVQRLIDFNTRNQRETEVETARIRSSQTVSERALEAREKNIMLITILKEQLHQEMRGCKPFLHRSLTNENETNALRHEITDSMSVVSHDPYSLDPAL
ncbi:unnamed protein product, partial [Rotaria sp. Silwood2]